MVMLGSAPESALFFVTYELCKQNIHECVPDMPQTAVHMSAASIAEVVRYYGRTGASACD